MGGDSQAKVLQEGHEGRSDQAADGQVQVLDSEQDGQVRVGRDGQVQALQDGHEDRPDRADCLVGQGEGVQGEGDGHGQALVLDGSRDDQVHGGQDGQVQVLRDGHEDRPDKAANQINREERVHGGEMGNF